MKNERVTITKTFDISGAGKAYSCAWGPAKIPPLRPTWAEIDVRSFKRNIKKIKKYLGPRTKLIAVVKANAHGHGADCLAEAALNNGAWALGVSSIEEGITLRERGIKGKILILGSIYPLENLKTAAHYRLVPTISSLGGLTAYSKLANRLKRRLPFHLKIDTGMGRIGVTPATAPALFERIVSKKEIVMEGLYTHFAAADCDEKFTAVQMKKFMGTVKAARVSGLKFIAHASNSAALFKHKDYQLDAVRPGISIYGLKPFAGTEKFIKLDPVMSLKTKIVFLKRVPAGTTVSYGASFITKKRSVIATLPVGYADGFNRLLSGIGEVLVRGVRCPVAGRVTMDMTMIDVTKVPGVSVGDEVVLIGRQPRLIPASSSGKGGHGFESITAEDIAEKTGAINYEVTCSVSSRVPRVLIN